MHCRIIHNVNMAKGKTQTNALELDKAKPSKFTAFNSVNICGNPANVKIEKKNFVFSTQVMLFLQGLIWGNDAEVFIKQIIAVWCPTVEPGALSSITVTMSYDLGNEVDDLEADEIVVQVTGAIAEPLRVSVYPTKPIIKAHDQAFYMPWSATAHVDGIMESENQAILGVLKLWCDVDVNMFKPRNRSRSSLYRSPEVAWGNVHYPYYVPLYLIKKARGIMATTWRDTDQYRLFKKEIIAHIDTTVVRDASHLTLMQIMSKEDVGNARELTTGCHLYEGGFCTCGDKVTKFLSSVLVNNNKRCMNHGKLFDKILVDIMTGHTRKLEGHPLIRF
ncbi:putative movement protein [Zhuye pepper nucleorhabdovirus]|uniref:Movement protein n=1 Tax=Zhuye pepper nucleorhabdovirus TaxID=2496274 RepID=A0A4P2UWR1_9RHAB|nr:putative movement protein [Green Sichuan pepper nucleorhabdovirus]AZN18350.1 putative movement protein [Zhuye pepper nucleorhabdovirus]